MIIVALVRASGLRTSKAIDSVWGTYWQFISAEVGLIMTAVTAFRTLFISRSERSRQSPRRAWHWYAKSKGLLKRTLIPGAWRSNFADKSVRGSKEPSYKAAELPNIPRATITGIRTFINRRGKTQTGPSQIMHSEIMDDNDDAEPLSNYRQHVRVTTAHSDVPPNSVRVCCPQLLENKELSPDPAK